MSDRVFLDGRLQPAAEARIPIADRGFRYGEGVFETLRARGERVFRAADHLRRLRRSAAALRWELPWTDDELAGAIRATLAANPRPESRVRVQATRGAGGPDHVEGPPLLLVQASPFDPVPEELRRKGVTLEVSPWRVSAAGVAASAKTTAYVLHLLARGAARERGAFEALLRNEAGDACEAAMANLFTVQGSILRTPPVDAPCLPGVTRGVVLWLAGARPDLDVREEPVRWEDLRRAEELFLTSTGVEVLPVRALDGHPIGSGRPGPVARALGAAYRALLDDELGPHGR